MKLDRAAVIVLGEGRVSKDKGERIRAGEKGRVRGAEECRARGVIRKTPVPAVPPLRSVQGLRPVQSSRFNGSRTESDSEMSGFLPT